MISKFQSKSKSKKTDNSFVNQNWNKKVLILIYKIKTEIEKQTISKLKSKPEKTDSGFKQQNWNRKMLNDGIYNQKPKNNNNIKNKHEIKIFIFTFSVQMLEFVFSLRLHSKNTKQYYEFNNIR